MSAHLSSGLFHACFARHRELLEQTERACFASLTELSRLVVTSLNNDGKILLFGNGGSAADAQHLAAEFTIRFVKNRRPLAAIALTTDSSALTACSNDYGYERVFARQLEALGRPGDVAIGISTSGNSPSVTMALRAAREQGLTAAGFSGRTGGSLAGLAEPLILVPSEETARIQEMHILLGHILCAEVEYQLGVG